MDPEALRSTGFLSEQRSGEVQFWRQSIPLASGGELELAAGYRRCRTFDRGNEAGQDFMAVRFDQGHVVGVVTDGVSQSFHGEIAARSVATLLLDELWEYRNHPPDKETLSSQLLRRADEVRREIDAIEIPQTLPVLVRMADEQTRSHGSQAVFSAFVLDVHTGRLHLYKSGDAPAVIFAPEQAPEFLETPAYGRWSSSGQVQLHLVVVVREDVDGCLIHSDGLGGSWRDQDAPFSREGFIQLAEERCELDDVSFVWIQRQGHARTRSAAPEVPPPLFPPPPGPGEIRYPAPLFKRCMIVWISCFGTFIAGGILGVLVTAPSFPRRETQQHLPAPPPGPGPDISPPASGPGHSAGPRTGTAAAPPTAPTPPVFIEVQERADTRPSGQSQIQVALRQEVNGRVEVRLAGSLVAELWARPRTETMLRLFHVSHVEDEPLEVAVYDERDSLLAREQLGLQSGKTYHLTISHAHH